MDLLRELYLRLRYVDQCRLAGASRLYASALFTLRDDALFWSSCCAYRGVPLKPSYTASQYEYWFYYITSYREYLTASTPTEDSSGASSRNPIMVMKVERLHSRYPPFFDLSVLRDAIQALNIQPSYIKYHLRNLTTNATKQGASAAEIAALLSIAPPDYPTAYIQAIVIEAIKVNNTDVYHYIRKHYQKQITLDFLRHDLSSNSDVDLAFFAAHDPVVLNSPRAVANIASQTLPPNALPVLRRYLAKFDIKKINATYERVVWYRRPELPAAMLAIGDLDDVSVVNGILTAINNLSANNRAEVDIPAVLRLINKDLLIPLASRYKYLTSDIQDLA